MLLFSPHPAPHPSRECRSGSMVAAPGPDDFYKTMMYPESRNQRKRIRPALWRTDIDRDQGQLLHSGELGDRDILTIFFQINFSGCCTVSSGESDLSPSPPFWAVYLNTVLLCLGSELCSFSIYVCVALNLRNQKAALLTWLFTKIGHRRRVWQIFSAFC